MMNRAERQAAFERALPPLTVVALPCHCGGDMHGSDHCPFCGCEEHEGTCDHEHTDEDERLYG